MVCLSKSDGVLSELIDRDAGLTWAKGCLKDPKTYILGHNISFDLAVLAAGDPTMLPDIFDAYDADRIGCTMVLEMLHSISRRGIQKGEVFNLGAVAAKRLGVDREEVKKGPDAWRLRYRELDGIPIPLWPEAAQSYARGDAEDTYNIFQSQLNEGGEEGGLLPDFWRQCRADWALRLMGAWGVLTDGKAVRKLKAELIGRVETAMKELVAAGIFRLKGTQKKPKFTKDTKLVQRLVLENLGEDVTLTDGGEKRHKEDPGREILPEDVCCDEENLLRCTHPMLRLLASISHDKKMLESFIPLLEQGTKMPIHAWWNILVNTGRTSCREPNLQQLPRKGGARECFIPRPGHVFISCDYHTAELRSLAQYMLERYGESAMADAIRAGKDLHLVTGASILGITYAEMLARYKSGDSEAKDIRQLGKTANFAFPGGQGAKGFVLFAAGPDYGITLTLERAKEIRDAWLSAYPEMNLYFRDVGDDVREGGGSFTFIHPLSNRIRGRVAYCDGLNSSFQGRTADGAKDACYEVVRECYLLDPHKTGKTSPLFGSRLVIFVHDELIVEAPEECAAEAGERLAEIMIEQMNKWTPDVPASAEPALMRRWSKAAGDAVWDSTGRLIPWEDAPKNQKGKALCWEAPRPQTYKQERRAA